MSPDDNRATPARSRIAITAADCITAVGLNACDTASAVRTGISRLRKSDQFVDGFGQPIVEACIPWLGHDREPFLEERLPWDEEPLVPGDEEEVRELDALRAEHAAEPEEADAYELARQEDVRQRISVAALDCLEGLLESRFGSGSLDRRSAVLFLGLAHGARPGPRYEGDSREVANRLLDNVKRRIPATDLVIVTSGNASGLYGLRLAAARLARDPDTICVVGAFDSLLARETLMWYDHAERLKSESPGRNHGLSPGEASAFLVVESRVATRQNGTRVLCEVAGLAAATEPNPFLSDRPSRGQGLTEACSEALKGSGVPAASVDTVLCDLDGEFHRAKDWALAQTRCFGSAGAPALLHPADCFGSVGAAWGALLVGLAAVCYSEAWMRGPALVFSSDDAGECAAAVLNPLDHLG